MNCLLDGEAYAPALKEDPNEYQALLDSVYDEFLPVGRFEEDLVIKIANCIWRARRAYRAETAQIRRQLLVYDPVDQSKPLNDEALRRLNRIEFSSIPNVNTSAHIQTYELRLDRQLCRIYSLLASIQSRRKSEMIQDLKQGGIENIKNEPLLNIIQEVTPPHRQIAPPE